jgi:pyrroline-5-carboxylate reductase
MVKIGVIGYGNIGEAMVLGMIKSGFCKPENVLVSSRDQKKIKTALDDYKIGVTRVNSKVVEFADYLILAVKPLQLGGILDEIKPYITEDKVIISVVSSIEIDDIVEKINHDKVVRTMLNTPVMVNEGMSALSFAKGITYTEEDIVISLFKSFGQIEIIEEKYMDIITAVSGTSPAYVFMMIEAMADGGVLMGLPRRKAYRMSAQAVLGAAKMVLDSDRHPGELKDMVCSPGGSTIDGVYTLESNNFRGTIMKTIKDATNKVISIGNNTQMK